MLPLPVERKTPKVTELETIHATAEQNHEGNCQKSTGDISSTGDIISPVDNILQQKTIRITLKNQRLDVLEVLEIFYLAVGTDAPH